MSAMIPGQTYRAVRTSVWLECQGVGFYYSVKPKLSGTNSQELLISQIRVASVARSGIGSRLRKVAHG